MLVGFQLGISLTREGDRVGDQPHRGAGREGVGAAREVLLDDVVLGRAGERGALDPVLLGDGDVEAEQPGGGGVDRHRGVHLVERDPVEQRVHVAPVGDRDADLADLAAGEHVVGVVAGLGRQVEGDREPRLALGEVAPVELVRAAGVGVARVGAHHPGAVGLVRGGDRSSGMRRMIFALEPLSPRSWAAGARQLHRLWADGRTKHRAQAPGPRPRDRSLGARGRDRRPRSRELYRDSARGARRSARGRLLLTHIHLDHAGASGALAERFPGLKVYVHERGAPHMVDPSRLLKSAGMLYGDEMHNGSGARWCRCRRSGSSRCSGGEEVEGLRVEKVRGHANHHVAYLDAGDRRVLHRRHGRRPGAAVRSGLRADPAAGDRRRGLVRVDRTDRVAGARAPVPDPLRRRSRRIRSAAHLGRAAASGSASAAEASEDLATASASTPGCLDGSTAQATQRSASGCARRCRPIRPGWASSATGASAASGKRRHPMAMRPARR